MFGQVGFFNKFAGKAHEDKRPQWQLPDVFSRIGALEVWSGPLGCV
jgi:hypothetical protein